MNVTVRNRGTRVEHFDLAVLGRLAQFARLYPPALQVFPDTDETAEVRFHVPRASYPEAGRYPFRVVARARVDVDVAGHVDGALTVGRFDEMTASIEPEMTRGRRPGRHRLTVVNLGNGPLDVKVALADQQGELSFNPGRFGGRLAPGATATEDVVVAAPLKWFGRTQVHPFSGSVSTDVRGQAAQVQARRRQVPRFPWWVPTALLAAVAIAFGVIALLPKAKVPTIGALDRLAAAKALSDAGYTPAEIEQADKTVKAGLAIRTDPPAGTELPKGQRVQLIVSRGECSDVCLIHVPDVHGLTVADATRDITTAKFVVDRSVSISDPSYPAGQVVFTNPAAGVEAVAGSKIVLTVSTGPPATPSNNAASPPPNGGAPTNASGGGAAGGGAAGGGAAGGGAAGGGGGPAMVTIPPDILGQPAVAVEQKLKEAKLTVVQTPTRSNKVARDAVLSSDPAPGTSVAEASTVTLQVGVPTGPIDLLAPDAIVTWSDAIGPITFDTQVPGQGFAGPLGPTALVEDGTTGVEKPGLVTAPDATPGAFVIGTFSLKEPVIAGDHLVADVGLLQGAAGVIDFSVKSKDVDLTPVVHGVADGKLDVLDVDLTPAVGATQVQIVATAAAGGPGMPAIWRNLRIEGRTG
jgi:beta-lactam-binding protein with PASTA domain